MQRELINRNWVRARVYSGRFRSRSLVNMPSFERTLVETQFALPPSNLPSGPSDVTSFQE